MPGEARSTRDRLLQGALEELSAEGQADFTMEGVATRAYFSVGSVYRHWPERSALLLDLLHERISPVLQRSLSDCIDPEECIAWLLGEGRSCIELAGEILLAGHGDEQIAGAARELWHHFVDHLGRIVPPSMAWYLATYALGNALLDVIGIPGPDPARGRVVWLSDACMVEREPLVGVAEPAAAGDFVTPSIPALSVTDETAVALIAAARTLLAERGVHGTTTRSISTTAGVTTGAVYRRYEAKSRLFADVLLTELSPERYSWTWDLIDAFASSDPYRAAADVMSSQLIERSQDSASQRVLLQIGIAARHDNLLRAEVQRRVEAANASRTTMFGHFIEAGIVRDDVDPAVFAWGFQTLPVGVRALVPLGISLDASTVADAMAAILGAAAR